MGPRLCWACARARARARWGVGVTARLPRATESGLDWTPGRSKMELCNLVVKNLKASSRKVGPSRDQS